VRQGRYDKVLMYKKKMTKKILISQINFNLKTLRLTLFRDT